MILCFLAEGMLGGVGFCQGLESSAPEAIKNRLRVIDGRVQRGPERLPTGGLDIRNKEIYPKYLEKASVLTSKLVRIKTEADSFRENYSLQRLAALTQGLSIENTTFRDSFQNGEEQYQSYQMIQKAIQEMEDAIAYWRQANRSRMLYRGTQLEKAQDDEVLKLKLEMAFSAIEQLKGITQVRQVLDRNLEE
jgi:hypothetical protein